MEEICKRMKQMRKDFCLTQVEFARRIGVTNAHISKIEKGKTVPSESLIRLICKELNVNENWLKNGENPMEIDTLLISTERSLEDSTRAFNRFLRLENPTERAKVAEIKALLNKILEIDLPEERMLEYLNICADLFKMLDYAVSSCKLGLLENPNQLSLTPNAFDENITNKIDSLKTILTKLYEFCKNV